MSYISFAYLFLFLGTVWLFWALLPQKYRPIALLAGSLVFYMATARQYVVVILIAAAFAWAVGRLLGHMNELQQQTAPTLPAPERKAFKKKISAIKKGIVTGGTVGLLGLFIWIKYLPFLLKTFNSLFTRLPGHFQLALPTFVMPLGLSFFSLMAVSYVVDVYRGTTAPAAHYWQLLLYLSFWPHVVEGPFDRYGDVAPALLDPPRPSYTAVAYGAQRIVLGMFKKLVIADRANMYVKAVFDDYTQYSGMAILVGTLLYTLQLYAEFSGCMDIVLGSAEAFGVKLAENFRQPFLSRSVSEFWRRWHITLGAWLREYLFQPLIISKPMQRFGKFCREKFGAAAGRTWPVRLALVVTWAAIGWWHGAGWIYFVYGMYYCAIQILGELAEPHLLKMMPELPKWRETKPYKLFQTLRTFVLVCGGMLLFRSNSTAVAIAMLRSIFTPYTKSLLIKIDARDMAVLLVGAVVLLVVDVVHVRRGHGLRETLSKKPLPLRWAAYILVIVLIMVFGAYGKNYDPAAFIYAQF